MPDMTQDKRRDELIENINNEFPILHEIGDVGVIADFIFAREKKMLEEMAEEKKMRNEYFCRLSKSDDDRKKMLEEIEELLNNHNIEVDCPECGGCGWYSQQVSDTEQEQRQCECCQNGRVLFDGVVEALATINKYKGGI